MFLIYQAILLFATLIGPSSVILVVSGMYTYRTRNECMYINTRAYMCKLCLLRNRLRRILCNIKADFFIYEGWGGIYMPLSASLLICPKKIKL